MPKERKPLKETFSIDVSTPTREYLDSLKGEKSRGYAVEVLVAKDQGKTPSSAPLNEYQQYMWDSLPECDKRFYFRAKGEWRCITKAPNSDNIGDPQICEWCHANKTQQVLEGDEELSKFERKEEIKTREFLKRKEREAQIKASNKHESWRAPKIDFP
jgi:hypothetical protein